MNKLLLLLIQLLSYLWYFAWHLVLIPYFLILVSTGLDWFAFKRLNIDYSKYVLSQDLLVVKNLLVLMLVLVGVSLILSAWKSLVQEAQSFPLTIIHHKKFNPQKLVKFGAYGFVRHPMLLGYFFLLEALGVFLLSPSLVLWVAPLYIWVSLETIIFLEERSMRRWFGKEYEEYQRKVPAIIPRWTDLKNQLRYRNQS